MSQLRGQALIRVINKLPPFQGLAPRQIQAFLNVCVPRNCVPEEHVCGSGAPGDELYILISGRLMVKSSDGVQLAVIEPVTTVGEMGVVTRQPRSVTVVALEDSRLFVIPRRQFEAVLQSDADAASTVYRNIIHILAGKIINDNVRTRQYVLDGLKSESQLREVRHTADAAIDLLIRNTGMTRAEVEAQISGERRANYLEVMIVDDEPEIRRFAREALPDVGVIEAANGVEAADLLHERCPDLLITDIRMPKMDGYQLVSHVREAHPDLPVFAISGFATEADVQGHGFSGFLEKPVSIDKFRRVVHDALVRDAPGVS